MHRCYSITLTISQDDIDVMCHRTHNWLPMKRKPIARQTPFIFKCTISAIFMLHNSKVIMPTCGIFARRTFDKLRLSAQIPWVECASHKPSAIYRIRFVIGWYRLRKMVSLNMKMRAHWDGASWKKPKLISCRMFAGTTIRDMVNGKCTCNL